MPWRVFPWPRPRGTSGLGSALNAVMRTRVPAAALSQCAEADRVLVENVLILAQEMLPLIDVAECSIDLKHGQYRILVQTGGAVGTGGAIGDLGADEAVTHHNGDESLRPGE